MELSIPRSLSDPEANSAPGKKATEDEHATAKALPYQEFAGAIVYQISRRHNRIYTGFDNYAARVSGVIRNPFSHSIVTITQITSFFDDTRTSRRGGEPQYAVLN